MLSNAEFVYSRVAVEYPWVKDLTLDEARRIFNEIFGTFVLGIDFVEDGFWLWAAKLRDYDLRN